MRTIQNINKKISSARAIRTYSQFAATKHNILSTSEFHIYCVGCSPGLTFIKGHCDLCCGVTDDLYSSALPPGYLIYVSIWRIWHEMAFLVGEPEVGKKLNTARVSEMGYTGYEKYMGLGEAVCAF